MLFLFELFRENQFIWNPFYKTQWLGAFLGKLVPNIHPVNSWKATGLANIPDIGHGNSGPVQSGPERPCVFTSDCRKIVRSDTLFSLLAPPNKKGGDATFPFIFSIPSACLFSFTHFPYWTKQMLLYSSGAAKWTSNKIKKSELWWHLLNIMF